ncbi:DUF952 domain-containing protein [Acidocella sp.]|uniref:DUF952 domain-containing protein n=1 Tax=Acidocella sp. TaxID=50710 RepID=UPI00262BCF8B|nr:DUF952 domain-containing protein [Acidocella sp.]
MRDDIGYKVLTAAQFAALQAGSFTGAPIDEADGYIHLSTAAQLTETVLKHFAGQNGLIIAAVGLAALGDALRWEVSRGGQMFPHLYGRLTMAAVRAHGELCWNDGAVVLPGDSGDV